MKKFFTFVISMMASVSMMAQGWPSNYQGVILQGFYWDSFADTQWSNLESQADELAEFFKLVWIPQSGKSASEPSMGYNDLYWFNPDCEMAIADESGDTKRFIRNVTSLSKMSAPVNNCSRLVVRFP